uniref:Uncharacterized protein n=1 Tax=Rhizophagus irregularis (strain DAOM 181602 / DAOM 197198 / MUCL 43194) TaxID=747089 RepID=U9UFI0_RHIID
MYDNYDIIIYYWSELNFWHTKDMQISFIYYCISVKSVHNLKYLLIPCLMPMFI